jgi:hypothetical protein
MEVPELRQADQVAGMIQGIVQKYVPCEEAHERRGDPNRRHRLRGVRVIQG